MNKGKVYFGKKMRRDLWLLLISFVIMVLSGSVICSVINENDISKKLSLLLAGMEIMGLPCRELLPEMRQNLLRITGSI